MAWYEVERRYVMTDAAYVEAPTAAKARELVAEGDFFDTTGSDIERYMAPGPAKKVTGIPRPMWEMAGCPDDLPIKT